jgi:GT2 family glycosyltransferase
MASVAAVVPHWNRRELLETLIASLQAQRRGFDEMIVADNGSTDDSAAVAEQAGARVLRLGRNLGFAAAVNRGIEAASADWVAILNNDITLEPGWLAELLAAAEREHAWFATGKILRAGDPATLDGSFDEISRGACACRCGAGKPDSPFWDRPRRIRIAPMTAAIFRRALFDEIGPLDESFGSYLEDVDFGLRCALAGRDGVYVPAAVSHHRGSATMGAWNKDTVRLIARNQVLLAAKHFHGQPLLPIVAGQLLWGAVAVRHVRGVAYLLGKISGMNAAGVIRRQLASPQAQTKLRSVAEAGEEEILELQRQTGFDWYWRAYFWLLPR